MRKKLGILIIFFSIAITWLCWLFARPTKDIAVISGYSQLVAACALVLFALINFISTRHKVVDYLFYGLDRSYIYHKYLGISALLLIFAHDMTMSIGKRSPIQAGLPKDPYAIYGSLSLYSFVMIMLIAILAKKLNYKRWKTIHKFMLLGYALGIYHYYGSATYAVFSINVFSIWLNIINGIGLLSAIYSIFFYEKTAFKYHFKVKKLDVVAKGTLEITGSPLGANMDFQPGQFAFLKILDKDNQFASHPFTISQAPKNGELQFTIKGLGDDTRAIMNTLKIGDKFVVEGPHGKFNYRTGAKNQIWIAGGIGVTPFRSFLQAGIPEDYSINFFYAYNSEENGAYVNELQELACSHNIKIHLFNSKEKGHLSVSEMSHYVKTTETIDIYFCGPKPMRESLKKQFISSKLKVGNFHYENFQFRDF